MCFVLINSYSSTTQKTQETQRTQKTRMETIVLNLKDQTLYWKHIEAAAQALRMGELVAFPTETVYGLGARRDDTKAI